MALTDTSEVSTETIIQTIGATHTVGSETPTIDRLDGSGNILESHGTTVPTNATAGYAKSGTFRKTNVVAGTAALYENIGSTTSCEFNLIGAVTPGEITLAEGQLLVGNSLGVAAATTAGSPTLISTSAGALGPVVTLTHNSATPANSDVVGRLLFVGRDDALAAEDYGRIQTTVTDVTAANPDSTMALAVDVAGTLTDIATLSLTGVTLSGTRGVVSAVSNANMPFILAAAQQALAGAGAVNLTSFNTTLDTNAGAAAVTLAAGAISGQHKRIQMIVDNGDATLTVTSLSGGTTITFADVGDVAELLWNGTNWIPIALYNCADGATAPVLA